MRRLLLSVCCIALCGSAAAHDFWLQPLAFRVAPGDAVPITLLVGHGPARQRSPIGIERITEFRSLGAHGSVDQMAKLHPGGDADDATLSFDAAGSYLMTLSTNYTTTTLPAIRYNDYLAAEGLSAVAAWRTEHGLEKDPGRELYARRAKTIVEVGDSTAAGAPVTVPLGLSLEIVPDADPVALTATEALPVHVLYNGAPLAGALVKLTDLAADEKPVATALTDASGAAVVTVPYAGSWLLNVIWSEPAPGNPVADYVTTFSSLSFAVD